MDSLSVLYPILGNGGVLAIEGQAKADMLAKALVEVHSSGNMSEEGRKGRQETNEGNKELLEREEEKDDAIKAPFTLEEMKWALGKSGLTAPGKDQICYTMLSHLSDKSLEVILHLYNKIWQEGKLPQSWKHAVIVPIRKPGKDPTNPSNYRPIALMSHMCKVMERMITEKLTYYLEIRNLRSQHQSGFRKGRGTMDPILCLETEVRKAQVSKKVVVAVFFDVEKTYDLLWKEGLLIKIKSLGITGKMFRWVKESLYERSVEVRVGKTFSARYGVDNGTPQGSVISPLLFSIMIDDVYEDIGQSTGRSLFADDGALWKRGRNVKYVVKQLQESIKRVEQWSLEWGFNFSVEKTNTLFFARKETEPEVKLYLYGKELLIPLP